MRVDELIGSLKTFELNLTQRKKEKFIPFKIVQEIENEEWNEQLLR